MPFTDEQPFLDAIAARHHDDGLRFIYADFLEDSGDADRAELVRIQVALARMGEDHPHRAELANREADLLAVNGVRWSEHLGDSVLACEFRRGILDSVALDAAAFLAKGEELFRRAALRRIRLRDAAPVVADLAHSPLLARVRELDLCDNTLGNAGVLVLVQSPHLRALEALDLGYNGIDDGGVRTLARASTIPALTSLSLSFNREISAAGVVELAASPFPAGLTSLDLSSNAIDETGLSAVIASPTLRQLHTLRLSENRIADAGAAALAHSGLLERMLSRATRLELRDNRIGPAGAAALAGSPLLARCLALDLTRNAIEDDGLSALLQSEHLRNLRVLKVGRNQITDTGIGRLRPVWPRVFAQLRSLDLSENRLTSYGIRQLESFNHRGLDVSRNVQSAGQPLAPDGRLEAPPAVDDVAAAAELRRRVSHPALRRPQ